MSLGLPSRLPASPAIGELIKGADPTFSFEFFPPKTRDGERLLWQAIRELESLQPSFVSITYGAGGTTRDNTIAITEKIATDTTLLFVQYTGAEAAAEEREAADVRHGAPLVHAVAKSTVPHLTLMIGATPAAEMGGIYGRAYEPRFLFSWPVERPAADESNPRRKLPDDGVLDPRDTRTVLGLCLSAVHSAAVEGAEHVGVFRP